MPQIELLLLFWALGKCGRNVSAEPQDRMALLQVWGGQPQEECKLVGSLIYELCRSKATEVMDFRIDSFKQQFQKLATVYERVEDKEKECLEENTVASHGAVTSGQAHPISWQMRDKAENHMLSGIFFWYLYMY